MKSRSNQAFASSPSGTLPSACDGFSPLAKKLAFVPLIVAGAMSAAADTTGAPAAPTNTAQPPTSPTQAAPTAASANQTASTSTVPAQSASTPAAPTSGKASTSAKKDDDVTTLSTVEVSGEKPKEIASPKFTQPILDTPQTVIAIPQEVYSQQGATTLTDVLRNTPGITLFAGEGGSAVRYGGDSFYMRGFQTTNSIFVDGVRDEGAITYDMFNIEQVDVVKGPSPENGRGGTAGYINLETKTPTLQAFEDGTTAYTFGQTGSQGSYRGTLDINQPLDTSLVQGAAVRVNVMGQNGGVNGRDIAQDERWGVAPSLALGLGTPTRVILSYQHMEEYNLPDYGLPTTVLPATTSSLYSPGISPDTYYGFANYDHEVITSDIVTARIEHDFSPDMTLSNQTSYANTNRYIEAASPTTKAPSTVLSVSDSIYQTDNIIASNQTNFSSKFDTGLLNHDLSTGLELSREAAYAPGWNITPGQSSYVTTAFTPYDFDPYASIPGFAPSPNGYFSDTLIYTEALYAFDTVKLGKYWQGLVGFRLEHYDINYASYAAGQNGAPATYTHLTPEKTSLSWQDGLVFKPRPNGSFYATYGTEIIPPGTSSNTNALSTSASSADNPALTPETAINYEVGTKWNFFSNHLLTTLALFDSINNNVPITDPITGDVTASSKQTVRGIELSATGQITDDWSVFAGYAYMDADVSSVLETAAGAGSGLSLPLLPTQSGNVWTTYRLPRGFTVGAGAQYMGPTARLQAGQASASSVGLPSQVSGYWLFNTMVSYEVNKHLTLRLNVNNLLNRDYIASLNNNGQRVNLGMPQTFILTAVFAF